MEIKKITQIHPTPEELVNPVPDDEIPSIIFTNQHGHIIKWTELRNLALKYWSEVEGYALQRGQFDIGFMGRECIMCAYCPGNIFNRVMNTAATDSSSGSMTRIPAVPENLSLNCTYESKRKIKDDIRIVRPCIGNKKPSLLSRLLGNQNPIFYAEANPCVIEHSMILALLRHAELDRYQKFITNQFRRLEEFEAGRANPADYLCSKILKEKR
jgi:hypothetical protein